MQATAAVLPPTSTRVERVTCPEVNEKIKHETLIRLAHLSIEGPEAIDRRLRELDQEWDIERLLECNASSITLAGLGLGLLVDKRWFVLPLAVSAFLLLHAMEGWCPPIPVLRRLGVRTATEINLERTALRILRGDFRATSNPKEAMELADDSHKSNGRKLLVGL